MVKIDFPSSIFVLSALSIMAIGFLTPASLPISREIGRHLGLFVFLSGMSLFTWASLCLKVAFYGCVVPVTQRLVTNGPYSQIRHPLYLSMFIILVGLCLALRSLFGIAGIFIFFLPAVVYRARLEEQALETSFGRYWQEYKRRTFFLLPFVW
jgi:protein-S-isoprenylcysteine O-methyltransferase Ste14